MAEGWLVQESCVIISEYLSRSQNNALELWSMKDDDRVVGDVPQGNGVVKRFSEEVRTKVVFYLTRSNPRWWYVIQTAPRSRHIFDKGGVEEDLPEHAMEEENEANNFTSGHLHTAMSDVETSMSREETSSDDSSDESRDHESDGNNDDHFNSIDEDDTATLNSVTSYLGLAAYTRTDILTGFFGHSIIYAGMPVFSVGDAVDLLDGGEVVAKGRVVNVDPSSTLHGQPMPHGHVSLTVVWVLNRTVHIPYVPPHEPNLDTLADVVGYIIAWPSVALAHVDTVPTHSRSSRRSHSRSSRRSHSSSSSQDSTGSKYSSMSEEEFEAEARRRGKREEPPYGLETVYEESDSNFKFRPRTQLQFDEPCIAGTSYTPDTTEPPSPIAKQLVIETPPFTPIEMQPVTPIETSIEIPIETPTMTPFQYEGAPISNAKGKRVISRMHELMWIYFPDDILTDWRRQPRDSKQAVIDQLHRKFPNLEGHRFKEKAMLSFMNHKEVVGRAPIEAEYMEGRDNSLGALLERMRRDGIAFTPRPKQRPGSSDHAIALDVEMDAEDKDQSYVPSDDEETEDEVMESETDQDIWLQDVEHPTSSCRPKGRR
ncbi:hypothetical protein L7F22_069407 [Adiantum nelumboides]|nr:hypothetical protein [Adiantum nelumboides]